VKRWCMMALLALCAPAHAELCGSSERLQLQILGSGAGELGEGRAAPSAILWVDGKARLLVDVGPGAAMRLMRSGANLADLDAVLLTHLHTNRTADLPVLIQLMASLPRSRPLHLYGPNGNRFTPSTVSFVRSLFDPARGAWRHLGDVLSPLARSAQKLEPHDVRLPPAKLGVARDKREQPIAVFAGENLRVTALPLNYGEITALAWQIESHGKRIVMDVNTTVEPESLERFAKNADMLITSHAVVENAGAGKLAPVLAPASIGRFAQASEVKRVVLNSRARDMQAQEGESDALIRRHYDGNVSFADDLECITP
jgi:ribonuclease BN (tRNA processing enzyme)